MWNQKKKPRAIAETLRPSARTVVLQAHFRAHSRADRAAEAVGGYAHTVFVSRLPGTVRQLVEPESRFSLTSPRLGALLGALAGLLFMALSFSSRFPSLAGDAEAMRMMIAGSFLVTGLSAAAGWLAGMAAQTFSPAVIGPGYEVRALVSEFSLDQAERVLRAAGAQTVWVLGDESLQPALVEVEADYFD